MNAQASAFSSIPQRGLCVWRLCGKLRGQFVRLPKISNFLLFCGPIGGKNGGKGRQITKSEKRKGGKEEQIIYKINKSERKRRGKNCDGKVEMGTKNGGGEGWKNGKRVRG
jgi:hypothetical protein